MNRSGIDAFLEILATSGVKYIFGNPGTTELPLNDALVTDDRFQYILGLQEVAVMAMADGYAMASRVPAVVNLHACCGLGHALGILYNARREGTPLIVTAGQQDRRLMMEEPILGGDMVSVARPWTKWAYEVTRVEDIPSATRRAIQLATTPPTGPVFLSLPLDVQMERADDLDLTPLPQLDARVRPSQTAIEAAAKLLLSAQRPAILVGSRVRELDAVDELIAVAEEIGAAVFSEAGHTHGRLAFPSDHPLFQQALPMWSHEIRPVLEPYDVLLVVGCDVLRQYVHHQPSRAIPETTRLVHIDEDAYQLNKNYVADVAVLGHPQAALGALAEEVIRTKTRPQNAKRLALYGMALTNAEEARKNLKSQIASEADHRPLTPLALMGAIADVLPPNVAVIEEAVTTTGAVLERLGALGRKADSFGHRGWALGWGMGVAVGAKLAWPNRPVLALIGDGAAGYGPQALWSAAKYKIPVTFVICNNTQYEILKSGSQMLKLPQALANQFVGLELTQPAVDFLALAKAFGVEAVRVSEPDELRTRLRDSFARSQPLVIDVPIQRGF